MGERTFLRSDSELGLALKLLSEDVNLHGLRENDGNHQNSSETGLKFGIDRCVLVLRQNGLAVGYSSRNS